MKVILANPRGFCAGVEMAIQTVEQAVQIVGTPLYVYHEIVHNRHVVDHFVDPVVIVSEAAQEARQPRVVEVVQGLEGAAVAIRDTAQLLRVRSAGSSRCRLSGVRHLALSYGRRHRAGLV